MAVAGLSTLPVGSDVYIDANIFVYSMLGQSGECDAFLRRCGTDVYGYADVRVLHDTMHQLMLADAEKTSGNTKMRAPKELKRNPTLIASLSRWKSLALIVQQLPIEWIPLGRDDLSMVPAATSQGLLCGDALHTSLMAQYGITRIASRDADFSNTGLTVHVPGDI